MAITPYVDGLQYQRVRAVLGGGRKAQGRAGDALRHFKHIRALNLLLCRRARLDDNAPKHHHGCRGFLRTEQTFLASSSVIS